MTQWIVAAAAVLITVIGSGAGGWYLRDARAVKEQSAIVQANADEASHQTSIRDKAEDYLHAQLDLARTADAGAHLGDVRCVVSVRNPDPVQTAESPTAGDDATPAVEHTAPRTADDIGPELEAWARGLGQQRERARSLQYFDQQRAVAK